MTHRYTVVEWKKNPKCRPGRTAASPGEWPDQSPIVTQGAVAQAAPQAGP